MLYNGWLKVKEKTHNGKRFEVVESKDAVAAVIQDKNNKLLLVNQYRPSVDKLTYEIPAGILDIKGESPVTAMCRELAEESGLNISPPQLQLLYRYNPHIGFCKDTLSLYSCKIGVNGEDKKIEGDDSVRSIIWKSLKEVEGMINSGEITDGKTIIASLCLKKDR